METDVLKKEIDLCVDAQMENLWQISNHIFSHPEMAFEEVIACKEQCDYLRKAGFEVTQGLGSLPTAYLAKHVQGSGKPVVAILSEYDALAIGHACGHNLIACNALGSAVAAKQAMEKSGVDGTLLIMGTPAEESGGGKIILLNEGFFEGVDAVICMHPTTLPTRLAGECMSSKKFELTFIGKSAHASSHPHQGINALSAANMYFVGTGFLRQHFKGDMRLSGIITEGGEQTGLIPNHVKVKGSISCFGSKDLERGIEKVIACAKGSAMAMGCEVEIIVQDGYLGRTPNTILSEVCRKELKAIGEEVREGMPFDYGGEDLGNVSKVIPICNPYITLFKEYKISGHTEEFKALCKSEAGYRCIQVGSKAMARTTLELMLNPEIIERATEELKERLQNEQ